MPNLHKSSIRVFSKLMSLPLAYFLTWSTYGTWLHGDHRGWVNKLNACPETDYGPPCAGLEESAKQRMKFTEAALNTEQRQIVEQSVTEVCRFRRWELFVVNCRTNHIHVVVKCGDIRPEAVMNQFKSYATRALRQRGDFQNRRVWTRGGSTRYINTEDSLPAAIRYVMEQ